MIKRNQIFSLLAGALGGLVVLSTYFLFTGTSKTSTLIHDQNFPTNTVRYANFGTQENLSFTEASALATPAVVHIKASAGQPQLQRSEGEVDEFIFPFREFFDQQPFRNQGPSQSSGSGVIISADGYIVTNNHVINEASELQVTLNDNRTYDAKVIGTDPSTDLALIKIDESSLPTLPFGNSDQLQVGEWVLAVGNPFNLTSTVTAGIVSAKGRNINILSDKFKIEAFIQTDAAVNPGNSGGALVNTRGELVGINTAIATRTGTYNGYSFAVPAAMVKKIVDDLISYGTVQRGFLGVMIQDVNAKLAEEKDLDITRGVYVQEVNKNSAAIEAGIKAGDVITQVGGVDVNTSSQLQEQISRHRPGDVVKITLLRDGNNKTVNVTLKNKSGTTNIVTREANGYMEEIGAQLDKISGDDKSEHQVRHGVKVTDLRNGKFKNAGITKGFIITHIDKNPVYTPQDVQSALNNRQDAALIEGVDSYGKRKAFAIMF